MANFASSGSKDGSAASNAVFIDTNLDTHLAMLVSDDDSVFDLKEKIMCEHQKCFPSIGQINVNCLKVKRKDFFYHLSDSMLVRSAFHGITRNWFLLLEASTTEIDKPCSSRLDYGIETPKLVAADHLDSSKLAVAEKNQNNYCSASKGGESKEFIQNVVEHRQTDVDENYSANERLNLEDNQRELDSSPKERNAGVMHSTSRENDTGVRQECNSTSGEKQKLQRENKEGEMHDDSLSTFKAECNSQDHSPSKTKYHSEKRKKKSKFHAETCFSFLDEKLSMNEKLDVQCKVLPDQNQSEHVLHAHGSKQRKNDHLHCVSHDENDSILHHEPCSTSGEKKHHLGVNREESSLVGKGYSITSPCKLPSSLDDAVPRNSLENTLNPVGSPGGSCAPVIPADDHLNKTKSRSGKRKRKKTKTIINPYFSPQSINVSLEQVLEHREVSFQDADRRDKALVERESFPSGKKQSSGPKDMGRNPEDVGGSSTLPVGNDLVKSMQSSRKRLKSSGHKDVKKQVYLEGDYSMSSESDMFLNAFTKSAGGNPSNDDATKDLCRSEGTKFTKDEHAIRIDELPQTTQSEGGPESVSMDGVRKNPQKERSQVKIHVESIERKKLAKEQSLTAKNILESEKQKYEVGNIQSQPENIVMSGKEGRKSEKSRSSNAKNLHASENYKPEVETSQADESKKKITADGKGQRKLEDVGSRQLQTIRTEEYQNEINMEEKESNRSEKPQSSTAKDLQEETSKNDTKSRYLQTTQMAECQENRSIGEKERKKSRKSRNSNTDELEESEIHEHAVRKNLLQASQGEESLACTNVNDKIRKKSRKPRNLAEIGRSQWSDVETGKLSTSPGPLEMSTPRKENDVRTDNSKGREILSKTERLDSKAHILHGDVNGEANQRKMEEKHLEEKQGEKTREKKNIKEKKFKSSDEHQPLASKSIPEVEVEEHKCVDDRAPKEEREFKTSVKSGLKRKLNSHGGCSEEGHADLQELTEKEISETREPTFHSVDDGKDDSTNKVKGSSQVGKMDKSLGYKSAKISRNKNSFPKRLQGSPRGEHCSEVDCGIGMMSNDFEEQIKLQSPCGDKVNSTHGRAMKQVDVADSGKMLKDRSETSSIPNENAEKIIMNGADKGTNLLTMSNAIIEDESDGSVELSMDAVSSDRTITPRSSSSSGYSTEDHTDMDSHCAGSFPANKKSANWKSEMESISGTITNTIANILRSSSSYKKAKIAADSQMEDIESQLSAFSSQPNTS